MPIPKPISVMGTGNRTSGLGGAETLSWGWPPDGEAGAAVSRRQEWVLKGTCGHRFLLSTSGGGEMVEEVQPLTDVSEGELESMRPGDEEGDASREDREEYDGLDQGEPVLQ